MSSSPRSLLNTLTIALVLMFALPAFAAVPEAIVKDFKPATGHIVMPMDGQYLIDLDASQRVEVGDVFSVIAPGQKIVDPKSKKVIGSLDTVKGVLQVTRVRSGYSYAKPMGQPSEFSNGQEIRRYTDLKTIFWDYSGQGESLYTELRSALPALDWQDYGAAQQFRPRAPAPLASGTQLYFILGNGGLAVRDADFKLLHSYPLQGEAAAQSGEGGTTQLVPAAAGVVTSPMAPASGIVAAPAQAQREVSAIVAAEQKPQAIVAAPEATGIWHSPSLEGTPVGIAVGDFDGDRQQEIAVAFADHLLINRLVGGQFTTLADIPFKGVQALALDDYDLDGNGRPELYVTAVAGQDLASLVVANDDGKYRVVQKDIPWYLRTVTLPDGPALLGEKMGDARHDFKGPIFRVTRKGNEVASGTVLDIPGSVALFSFVPLPQKNGEQLYAAFSSSEKLQMLSPAGKEMWESSSTYGGTTNYVERPDPYSTGTNSTRLMYLKARLSLGPDDTVLVPENEGMRLLARYRSFDRSRLLAMKWDGTILKEAWHTWPQDGYLADYCVADADNDGRKEIVAATVFDTGSFLKKSRSAVYIYEMP